MTERMLWIDVLKGVAIFGVLINHYNIFPDAVLYYVMYAVPTFFWIIGFNIYQSLDRKKDASFRGRLVGIMPFVFFYCVATIVYAVFYYKLTSVADIVSMIVQFSATGPLYFCPIYISIFLISGMLYTIIEYKHPLVDKIFKKRIFYYIFIAAACLGVSLLMKHFYIYPKLHGGGKYLFGKTYLFIVFAGMLYCKAYAVIRRHPRLVYGLCLPVLCGTLLVMPEVWSNPPNALAIAQSFAIFAMVSVFDVRRLRGAADFLALLGRYSIHIFMYHMFVIYMLASPEYSLIAFCSALLAPVVAGYGLNRLWAALSGLFFRPVRGTA